MPRTELIQFMRKYKSNLEIYHDLMPYRVREILLIATVYDAFILEQEGQLTERIFGEYYKLNLSTAPRITSVQSEIEGIQLLQNRMFDLIIIVGRKGGRSPFPIAKRLHEFSPDIPNVLLLADNSDTALIYEHEAEMGLFERAFVWNGDSSIFLAIIKYIEDKFNVDNDTKIGNVRIILLVEDSVRYYSRYLFVLYSEIIRQTQKLIEEERADELHKILRMRARPKVLLATSYEEAVQIIQRYKDFLLCVISDVTFRFKQKKEDKAGKKLIEYVRSELKDIPVCLQSSHMQNKKIAEKLHAYFIYKYSPTLAEELTSFIQQNLGFGDFIFRDEKGKEIDRARNLREFLEKIDHIPDQSLLYHARRNHFSAWLMARGEIHFAKSIQPLTIEDFKDAMDLRRFIKGVLRTVQVQRVKGRIANFDKNLMGIGGVILRISDGLLGGKARGIAFLSSLLETHVLPKISHDAILKIPQTFCVGTETYQQFWEENKLDFFVDSSMSFDAIKHEFVQMKLPLELQRKLYTMLKEFSKPIAVRSSGLFEDSVTNAFSGIYDTYILPNNHPNVEVRLQQLMNAIKLIYASVFSPQTRAYFNAIHYNIEEEQMAVIIQELVGQPFDHYYYPHISGVAQSYNYYPIANLEPEEGISSIALGLGEYVMEGEKAYIFSPGRPKANIIQEDELLKESQQYFYALDLSRTNFDLSRGENVTLAQLPISVAEKHGSLQYIASTWDAQIRKLRPGIFHKGQRILDFAYILKYNSFPLAEILHDILKIGQHALGTHVEIEFAIDLSSMLQERGSGIFYLLQIKPLHSPHEEIPDMWGKVHSDEMILFTPLGVGYGIVRDIYDVIYVDLDTFSRSDMSEIALELMELNHMAEKKQISYLLIGPGRWGSRDQWLGIPVNWQHISHACAIVEVGLPDFQFEPSLGSHFFHNITSMNIGYFMVPHHQKDAFIRWDCLKAMEVIQQSPHLKWVRSQDPLRIVMDGKRQKYAVLPSKNGDLS
jgi:hypothetical protein